MLPAALSALPALVALTAAVLAVPDPVLRVVPAAASALGLDDAELAGLLRATGASLPALLLTVPPAAVAARRLPAGAVLATGAALLLAGLAAARLADSVALIAAVRVVQGVGAGMAVPASLVLVWEHGGRRLRAAWAGAFAGMLILAMPLALNAVPAAGSGSAVPDWRVALAPVPWPAVAAVALALVLARPLLRGHRPRGAAARQAERGPILLAFVPAAGFTFLAVDAAHDWSPGARLVVAAAVIPALLGLALAGGDDAAAGGPSGCAIVMIAAGLLCQPVAGPLAGLTSVTADERQDGSGVPLLPFALAAGAAVAGALAAARTQPHRAVAAGCVLMIAGVLLGLVAVPHTPWTLPPALVPLGAGAGLALAASLRDAGAGAALFGLSLCFPALLAGQLAVLSLQASLLERLRPVTASQRADALLGAYHLWLAAVAVAAALLTVLAVRAARRDRRRVRPG